MEQGHIEADRSAGLGPAAAVFERHYRIGELAERWRLGRETVRLLVKDEQGVIEDSAWSKADEHDLLGAGIGGEAHPHALAEQPHIAPSQHQEPKRFLHYQERSQPLLDMFSRARVWPATDGDTRSWKLSELRPSLQDPLRVA